MSTAIELIAQGLEFVRDDHASIISIRGPKSPLALAGKEITRRVTLFEQRGFNDPSVLSRSGRCYCCNDPLSEPQTGGDCDLCTAARRKFYRNKEEQTTRAIASLSKGAP